MQAIEKRPEDRFQNVDEMLEALEQFEKRADHSPAETSPEVSEHALSNIHPADFEISYLSDPVVSQIPEAGKPSDATHSYRLRYAAAAVVLILALLVYFSINWFMPAPMAELMVVSNPRGAELVINGESAGKTPVYNYLVRSGPIDLRLYKDTFLTLDTVVHLEPDTLNYFAYDLLPAGTINFSTSPPDARVWINGRVLADGGQTEVTLPAGPYDIRIEKEGYQTDRDHVELFHGDSISRNYKLDALAIRQSKPYASSEKEPAGMPRQTSAEDAQTTQRTTSGALAVRSDPEGAGIWLDGYRIPSFSSPCIIEAIPPGLHEIELKKEGYRSYMRSVMVAARETTQVQAGMIRSMGELRVLVRPWGSIYIDRKMVRDNTNTVYVQDCGTGKVQVRAVHPTFGVWEMPVDIREDETTSLEIDFNKFVNVPVTAFDVEGKPVWADIIVDNEATGEVTPKEIALRVGLRTVAARKEGYILVNGEKQLLVTGQTTEPLKFILRKVLSSQAYRP
jgi:hypothetical protein